MELSMEKKLDRDLWIIIITSLVAFMLYVIFADTLILFMKDINNPILLRVLVVALVQFAIAGFGVVIVSVYRREDWSLYGLRKEGTVKTIALSFLCFIPYFVYIIASGQFEGYAPLSVLLMEEVLQGSLITNVVGVLIIAIAWGFFEGFNYAVIAKKLNQRYPNSKINIGALCCAIFCILIHPFSISFWGIIEILTTFLFIYGIIIIAEKNNNAWGCVVTFLLLWNAF